MSEYIEDMGAYNANEAIRQTDQRIAEIQLQMLQSLRKEDDRFYAELARLKKLAAIKQQEGFDSDGEFARVYRSQMTG